ncbi:MAG: acyl-CoA thioesterase [Myxococcales bacterium]
MERDEFTLLHTLRVRWAEVDRQGVVFNANYFLYFDVTITEYWRAIGFDYPDGIVKKFGTDIFAVKAGAEFHASAGYDDVLDIGCRTTRVGRSSLRFRLGVFRGKEPLTTGELVYVNVDLGTRKSAPWPKELVSAIFAFEKVRPEGVSD